MLPLSRPAARPAAASRSARPGLKVLRRACAVAAVALIPVLAGCEAGSDAPVLHWHPPTNGASATIHVGRGEIAIRNAFILGGVPNVTLPAGSSASMFVGLVNTGPRDRLIRVSAPGTATSVTLPTGGVLLERDQSALLTGPAPQLVLTGLRRSLTSGTYVPVLLTFQHAGTVSLDLPVLAAIELVRHVLAGPRTNAQRVREGQASSRPGGHAHPDRGRNRHGRPDPDPDSHGLTRT